MSLTEMSAGARLIVALAISAIIWLVLWGLL